MLKKTITIFIYENHSYTIVYLLKRALIHLNVVKSVRTFWILAVRAETGLRVEVLAVAHHPAVLWGRAVTEPLPFVSAVPTLLAALRPLGPLTPAAVH